MADANETQLSSLARRSALLIDYYLQQEELSPDEWSQAGRSSKIEKDIPEEELDLDDSDDTLLRKWVTGDLKFFGAKEQDAIARILKSLVPLLKAKEEPTINDIKSAERFKGTFGDSPVLSRPWRNYMEKAGLEVEQMPYFELIGPEQMEQYYAEFGKGRLADSPATAQETSVVSPPIKERKFRVLFNQSTAVGKTFQGIYESNLRAYDAAKADGRLP